MYRSVHSYIAVLIFTGMLSCDNGDKQSLVTGTPSAPVLTTPVTESALPSASTVPIPASTGARLNPKHGEPGHRCDLAVGAPLPDGNTNAVQPSTPAIVTNPVPAVTPALRLPQASAPGVKLNPKHGEPGHRCDIEVGAPLNSEPSAPVSVNIPPPSSATPSAAAPLQLPQLQSAGGKKLNPKHGEPGHRCDIAVGAPL